MSAGGAGRAAGAPRAAGAQGRVRIWDLPTRLFHWTLALLVGFSLLSGHQGWMDWHFRSGYAVLALLLFRWMWGFAGPRYARFASFPPSLQAVLPAARRAGGHAGHSPLGAWSVYALLGSATLQAVLGLFTNDEIFTEGPLVKLVSGATTATLSKLHVINGWLLLALVLLHLAAVFMYRLARTDLIGPMLSGDKRGVQALPTEDGPGVRLRALILLAVAAALVGYLASF